MMSTFNHWVRISSTLLCMGLLIVATEPLVRAEPLDDLIAEALQNNPDLQAAEWRWKMNEHKVVPAQTLDDPRLSVSLSNYPVDSLASDETPMTGNEVQLSQTLPFPGKLAARGNLAEQQALWYRWAYEDSKVQLTRQVKDTWYLLEYLDQAITITERNLGLLDDFIRLTETRYSVGTGLQQDVLKAQVERSKIMDRLYTLKQERVSQSTRLNALLNRPIAAPVAGAEGLEPVALSQTVQDLQDLAVNQRPLLRAYQALIDRSEAQKKIADLDYYPDFNVWAGYRMRDEVMGDPVAGTDFVSAGVSINLPIWRDKRREAVAEADSGKRMALRQLDDFRNQIFATISDSYALLEKNCNLVQLYGSAIIPQAQQTFEASLSAYQVGDVDFLNLLDSLLTLYRYQVDYQRAVSDSWRNLAQLEGAVGQQLLPDFKPALN